MNGTLNIRHVTTSRDRQRFVELPYQIRRADPLWVPPLRSSQAKLFAGKTAFFDHGTMECFLAERDNTTIGRIAAIENTAHNQHHQDRVGFFGFFECRDDADAAAALITHAGAWLKARNLDTLRGPVNPSMNAECGLLIDGFEHPPLALMPHHPPYYAALLENAGLTKKKDLYAYMIDTVNVVPGTPQRKRLDRAAELLTRRYPSVRVHNLDMRNYKEAIKRYMCVFEEARYQNWGYVPVTEDELMESVKELKMVVDPRIVLFADVDGDPAGLVLAVPDINRGLTAANGRMFPFGFVRFLRAMKKVDMMRVVGLAALDKYRHMGITARLLLEISRAACEYGYRGGEASWILEDNVMSNRTLDGVFNPSRYKTYRIYEKVLG